MTVGDRGSSDSARALGHGGDGRPPGVVGRRGGTAGRRQRRRRRRGGRRGPRGDQPAPVRHGRRPVRARPPARRSRSWPCAPPAGPASGADAVQARVEGLDAPARPRRRAGRDRAGLRRRLDRAAPALRPPAPRPGARGGDHLRGHGLPRLAAAVATAPPSPRARRRPTTTSIPPWPPAASCRPARSSAGPGWPPPSRPSPPRAGPASTSGAFGDGLLAPRRRAVHPRRPRPATRPSGSSRCPSTCGATPSTSRRRPRRAT